MQLYGRRFDTGSPVCVEADGDKIDRTTPVRVVDEFLDRWPWIAPGLVDLQINGHGGREFNSPDLTVDDVSRIARTCLSFGVTRFCPTLTTAGLDVLCGAMATIATACDASPELARRIAGVHLEGPYISRQYGPRGAHPLVHCREPNWDEFQRLQDASGGRIRILTLSPEFDGCAAFIESVVQSGVLVAIGHTAADCDGIRRAVDAGASLSTHLGNGCHLVLPRHDNCIWSQLAEDRLAAGLIVDGHHLPPAVVKSFVRAKTPRRCILVSDMSGMTGLPPGRYETGLGTLEILDDGRLVIAGQLELLAGASLPVGDGVANVMHFAGVDLNTAVKMATAHPAELLDLDPGGLEAGDPADLVQFDLVEQSGAGRPHRFKLRATVADGVLAWGDPWCPA